MIFQDPEHRLENHFGRVAVDGQRIPYIEWSVSLPAYDEADHLTIKAPWTIGGDGLLASNNKQATRLLTGKDIPLSIAIAERHLIAGIMDEIEYEATMSGEFVRIGGRGKIGRMVERKEIRDLKNRTASSVAQEIFKYHGITNAVVEGTSSLIGTYSEGGHGTHSATSNDLDDWELLNWLAEWEGFVVRVTGTKGYFGPHENVPEMKLPPISLLYGRDCEIKGWKRSLSGARDIIVEGRGYKSTGSGKSSSTTEYSAYYPREPKKDDETAIIHKRTMPGHTPEQLKRKVRSVYEELTKQDITVDVFVPRYLELWPDRRVALQGVGYGLSQVFYATQVNYSESMDGVTTEITLSNKIQR